MVLHIYWKSAPAPIIVQQSLPRDRMIEGVDQPDLIIDPLVQGQRWIETLGLLTGRKKLQQKAGIVGTIISQHQVKSPDIDIVVLVVKIGHLAEEILF